MSLEEIQEQAAAAIDAAYRAGLEAGPGEDAIDNAYNAGFRAALDALQNWADTLVTEDEDPKLGMDPCYIDGVNDAITTVEQAQ